MSTLVEIETAAERLCVEEKQRLLLYLVGQLRAAGAMPLPPRTFSFEQLAGWLKDDEADMSDFLRGETQDRSAVVTPGDPLR